MTDIVERIDWLYVAEIEAASPDPDMVKTYADAKAEIEHLRADNELLRAALREIITAHESFWDADIPADASECDVRVDDAIADTWRTVAEISTRALEGKDD